jgi:hypothetical protein
MALVNVQRIPQPDHIIAYTTRNHERRPIGPITAPTSAHLDITGCFSVRHVVHHALDRTIIAPAPPAAGLAEIAGVSSACPQQALAWLPVHGQTEQLSQISEAPLEVLGAEA